MRSYFGVVFACTLLCGASAFEWKTCAEGKADVSHVSLTPDPPQAGDTIKFSIDAESKIDVAEGSVAIAVAFRGLPVYSETKDLCERTTCPVAKGPLNLSYDEYLPPIVPPGPYVVTISVTSGDATEVADQLLCLEVDFDIAPPGARDVLDDISAGIKSKLHSGRRALA
uniref:Putative extracellular protein TR9_058 n=1 Tax=Trebouxia lynnae TaxID=1825957 RepID=A0A7L9QEH4_9CHLO|nr:putative extracellular protein TR9_058 [Trebouxia lynnae]